MEIKQTFTEWSKELEAMLTATKIAVRPHIDFLRFLFKANISTLKAYKIIQETNEKIDLDIEGPVPYNIGLSIPKEAEVLKKKFYPGDVIRVGEKGLVMGGRRVGDREIYFVKWYCKPDLLNGVFGESLKRTK